MVESAGSREAVAAIQHDLDGKWEKVQEKWQELLVAYPEPEIITDEAGDVIEDEEEIQEVRGKYSIRLTYLDAAENAQNRLEAAIRSKYTEFNIAERAGRVNADQERDRAYDLGSLTTYESSLEYWTDAKARLHPLINKLKISLDAAEVTSNLATAKKFKRWAVEIEDLRAMMDTMALDMIKAVPAEPRLPKRGRPRKKLQSRLSTEDMSLGCRTTTIPA